MPTTDSVSSTGPTAFAGTAAKLPNKYSDLSSEQFVSIMISELQNQDPLKPTDSGAIIEQMANIRSIQSDIDLSKKLDSLVTQNQLATAGTLLGQRVSGVDAFSRRVSGVVESISRTSEGPMLNLRGGGRVNFANVDRIDPAPVAAPTPTPTPTPIPTPTPTPIPQPTFTIPAPAPSRTAPIANAMEPQ